MPEMRLQESCHGRSIQPLTIGPLPDPVLIAPLESYHSHFKRRLRTWRTSDQLLKQLYHIGTKRCMQSQACPPPVIVVLFTVNFC